MVNINTREYFVNILWIFCEYDEFKEEYSVPSLPQNWWTNGEEFFTVRGLGSVPLWRLEPLVTPSKVHLAQKVAEEMAWWRSRRWVIKGISGLHANENGLLSFGLVFVGDYSDVVDDKVDFANHVKPVGIKHS